MGLNDWFSQAYALRLREVEQALQQGEPPLFVRIGDDLILLHDGRTRSASVRTERYHRLKAESHVPVALYLAVRANVGQRLTEDQAQRLRALRTELEHWAQDRPESLGVNEALAWLDELLGVGSVDEGMLWALEERTRQPILRSIEEAARVEMNELHRRVSAWTADWDRAIWGRLMVVVCAGAQPRYRQSTKQYFQRLLGDCQAGSPRPGRGRVLYSESCRTPTEAIRHVATYLVDRELGEAFMNSPLALQQDLLADAAAKAIDELMP